LQEKIQISPRVLTIGLKEVFLERETLFEKRVSLSPYTPLFPKTLTTD